MSAVGREEINTLFHSADLLACVEEIITQVSLDRGLLSLRTPYNRHEARSIGRKKAKL